MVFEDLFGTLLVQAEANYRENMAGLMDTLGWFANAICYGSVGASVVRYGWFSHQTIEIAVLVSVANFFATKYATRFGKRLMNRSIDLQAKKKL